MRNLGTNLIRPVKDDENMILRGVAGQAESLVNPTGVAPTPQNLSANTGMTNTNQANPDYQVMGRDYITNWGKDYGITSDMIGFKKGANGLGMITLGGSDLVAADSIKDGRSYVSNDKLRAALDTYTKQRGMVSNAQKYSPENNGYNKDQYSQKIDGLLESLLSRKPFQYDAASDPSFQSYQQMYGRAGDRALANTMSEASALTGGRLNTWAVSAGQGAKSQYDQQLMDVIPRLEQAAYGRYADGLANDRANLSTLMDADNQAYSRAAEALRMRYGMDRDAIGDARYADETKYNRGRDALDDKRYTDETAYNRGRDAVSDKRYTDETSYNRGQDKLNRDDRLREAAQANARGWASINLDKQQFAMAKEKWGVEKKQIEEAAKKVEMPDIFGEVFSLMMDGKRIDSSGRVVATGLTPEDWLKQEAKNLPKDIVLELNKIVQNGKKGSGSLDLETEALMKKMGIIP